MQLKQNLPQVVLAPVTTAHAQPNADSNIVTDLRYGAVVDAVEWRNDWVQILSEDQCAGWVRAAHLCQCVPKDHCGPMARVSSLFAHVYPQPRATQQRPLLTLPFDAPVALSTERPEAGRWWHAVRLLDGRTGWMQIANLSFRPSRLSISALAAFALGFVGIPFRWGGTTTFGYDCSGFVQMLCRQRGVALPRRARQHAEWPRCHEVPATQLKPADLLFFGGAQAGITHEGLFLGGAAFVHATNYGRPIVKISRLDEPQWQARLCLCRRIAGFDADYTDDELDKVLRLVTALDDASAVIRENQQNAEDDEQVATYLVRSARRWEEKSAGD